MATSITVCTPCWKKSGENLLNRHMCYLLPYLLQFVKAINKDMFFALRSLLDGMGSFEKVICANPPTRYPPVKVIFKAMALSVITASPAQNHHLHQHAADINPSYNLWRWCGPYLFCRDIRQVRIIKYLAAIKPDPGKHKTTSVRV